MLKKRSFPFNKIRECYFSAKENYTRKITINISFGNAFMLSLRV